MPDDCTVQRPPTSSSVARERTVEHTACSTKGEEPSFAAVLTSLLELIEHAVETGVVHKGEEPRTAYKGKEPRATYNSEEPRVHTDLL